MTVRLLKAILVATVAVYFTLVVFTNLADHDANGTFVEIVLEMQGLFSGEENRWRAINSPLGQKLFYYTIIVWEAAAALVCWIGTIHLLRSVKAGHAAFQHAKSVGLAGLGLGLTLFLGAFVTVGGEWFLMWQSEISSGALATAGRMAAVLAAVMIFVAQVEPEVEVGCD